MRRYEKITLVALVFLTLVTSAAVLLTSDWVQNRERRRATGRRNAMLVDTTALDTAQNLEQVAVTRRERSYASDALRLADYSVDLAFSIAMQDAANHPAPLTPEVKALNARLRSAQQAVASDQALVTGFTAQLTSASATEKDRLQTALGIVQTQLSLDQDDVQDAQQQLIRSGGDKQATIQQLLDEHNASEAHSAKPSDVGATNPDSPESTQAHNIAAEMRALFSLHAKQTQLLQAQHEAENRATDLVKAHAGLEQGMNAAKTHTSAPSPSGSGMTLLQQLSQDQKELAAQAKRLDTEQQLASVYGNWSVFVSTREKSFLHDLLVSFLWIFLIAIAAWVVNFLIQRAFASIAIEHRQLHTMRTLILVSVQSAGLVLILLVVFGMPSNLATVVGLATAGLTVAMAPLIVAILGWVVLMRKDGIRPGDWVEIEGVGGEVVDVGVLHTVLLESGTGADAGHPTGRKVSFMNGYAVQGHYFNFSTSGQWMWDEIEVQVPEGDDPYATAEAVLKIVADQTAENTRVAETEWSRSTAYYAKRSFSAKPTTSIKPAGSATSVTVRYIARAPERYATRAKIYRAIVELLHNRRAPGSTPPVSSPMGASAKS